MISNYTQGVTRIHFGDAEKKQVKRDKIYKELLNACRYGKVDVLQLILERNKAGLYSTKDELVGDLQIELKDNYDRMRKSFKMRVPNLTIENLIEVSQ